MKKIMVTRVVGMEVVRKKAKFVMYWQQKLLVDWGWDAKERRLNDDSEVWGLRSQMHGVSEQNPSVGGWEERSWFWGRN